MCSIRVNPQKGETLKKEILELYAEPGIILAAILTREYWKKPEMKSVPLLERMKFVSIFTSDLDEFFMIRSGSLYDMVSNG